MVYVISRNKLSFEHPKCHTLLVDFDRLSETVLPEAIDIAYCALGTTLKKAGSKSAQQHIDRDYVIDFAKLMEKNHCQAIGVVSSLGAKSSSSAFYLRTKGEMEEGVSKSSIPSINFIRPSLLIGPRVEKRSLEKMSMFIMLLLNPLFIGPLRKYRGITGIDVATKLIVLTQQRKPGVHLVDLVKK